MAELIHINARSPQPVGTPETLEAAPTVLEGPAQGHGSSRRPAQPNHASQSSALHTHQAEARGRSAGSQQCSSDSSSAGVGAVQHEVLANVQMRFQDSRVSGPRSVPYQPPSHAKLMYALVRVRVPHTTAVPTNTALPPTHPDKPSSVAAYTATTAAESLGPRDAPSTAAAGVAQSEPAYECVCGLRSQQGGGYVRYPLNVTLLQTGLTEEEGAVVLHRTAWSALTSTRVPQSLVTHTKQPLHATHTTQSTQSQYTAQGSMTDAACVCVSGVCEGDGKDTHGAGDAQASTQYTARGSRSTVGSGLGTACVCVNGVCGSGGTEREGGDTDTQWDLAMGCFLAWNPTATQQPRRPLPSTHTTLHSNTHTATGPTHTHTHSQRPNSAHSPHTQPSPTSKATHSAHTAWPHSSSSSHSHKSSHKGDSDSSKVNTTGWLYSFVRLVRVEPLDTHDRLAVAARSTSARPAAGTGRVGSIHALTPPHLIPQTTDVSSTTISAHLPHTQQATHTGSTAQRVSTVSSVEHVHSSTVRSSGNTSSTQRSTGPGQVPGVRGSTGVRTGLEAYSHWHKQKRLGGVREWDTCVRVAGTQGQQQQQRPGSAPGVGHRQAKSGTCHASPGASTNISGVNASVTASGVTGGGYKPLSERLSDQLVSEVDAMERELAFARGI